MASRYAENSPVVFRMLKHSTKPGPRAKDIQPAPNGETYAYHVEKYWRVEEVLADGQLVLVTRTGKRHTVSRDDERLRPARFWERFVLKNRFPVPAQPDATSQNSPEES